MGEGVIVRFKNTPQETGWTHADCATRRSYYEIDEFRTAIYWANNGLTY
jgi:hypothetical protein